jgi:hypothetical protein
MTIRHPNLYLTCNLYTDSHHMICNWKATWCINIYPILFIWIQPLEVTNDHILRQNSHGAPWDLNTWIAAILWQLTNHCGAKQKTPAWLNFWKRNFIFHPLRNQNYFTSCLPTQLYVGLIVYFRSAICILRVEIRMQRIVP